MPSLSRVLIVEDRDSKYDDVLRVLSERKIALHTSRASSVFDAESKIESNDWDLIILDISMDIRSSAGGKSAGGHANMGGMAIARKMYLLEREFPTIILSGFDSFKSDSGPARDGTHMGLAEIEEMAKGLLGPSLLGWVRYGLPGWEEKFGACVEGVLKS